MMKRILSAVMCAALLLTSVCAADTNTYADDEVEGLHEKLSALFMENYFTEEEFAAIDEEYTAYLSDYLLNEYLPLRQQVGKMETGSMEEEYALEMERGKLNYRDGIRVSLMANKLYTAQYAKEDSFDYLFSGYEYWGVGYFNKPGDVAKFNLDGQRIENISEQFNISYVGLAITYENIEMLRNETEIRDMLLEKGENKVSELKLFALAHGVSFLYIKCEKNEYLIPLCGQESFWDGQKYTLELGKLYTANEVMQTLNTIDSWIVDTEKPVYEAEAEALQAAGLLKGNENGLDLLKPLTRIEAAAMLLRAIGESETAESTVQVFADVPAAHWGFGAAAQAYTLGLIKGVGDNLFAPDKTVTAAEFSTMALRAANTGEFDWTQAVDIMIEKGILTQEQADKMDLFTRGDMAKIIYEARQNGLF